MMNHFRLAVGAGHLESYYVNWEVLVNSSDFSYNDIYHSSKFIERAGYWQLSEGLATQSEIQILAKPTEIYQLQVNNPQLDKVVQTLLRSYGGLFDGYTSIREGLIASRSGLKRKEVIQTLRYLHSLEIIDYKENKEGHFVVMTQPRIDVRYLRLPLDFYQNLKAVVESNADAMINYAFEETKCRSRMLLAYFGEQKSENCGVCDYCINLKEKHVIRSKDNNEVVNEIKGILENTSNVTLHNLIGFGDSEENKTAIKFAVQWMIDNGIVLVERDQSLKLN